MVSHADSVIRSPHGVKPSVISRYFGIIIYNYIMVLPDDYYVYTYHSLHDPDPYYVGMGKNDRAFRGKHRVPVPSRSMIRIVEQGMTQIGAWALERRLIRWYGRLDKGTGCLMNRSDGGPEFPPLEEMVRPNKQKPRRLSEWTNGVVTVVAYESPGDGWRPGKHIWGGRWWSTPSGYVFQKRRPCLSCLPVPMPPFPIP